MSARLESSTPTQPAVFLGLPEHRPVEHPRAPRPSWLKTKLKTGPNYSDLKGLVKDLDLHTVCQEASCPNIYECWEAREATFLIPGIAVRPCGFCDSLRKTGDLDFSSRQVAEAVEKMGREFAVVTGWSRRCLAEGRRRIWDSDRAGHRARIPTCGVEVLTRDLKETGGVATGCWSGPMFRHNWTTAGAIARSGRASLRTSLRSEDGKESTQPFLQFNIIVGWGRRSMRSCCLRICETTVWTDDDR